ncbi:hypothetical protein LXL04_011678 [Taraxacum kok-saghyz]
MASVMDSTIDTTQIVTPIQRLNTQTLDGDAIMNVFADWMTSQRWSDIKQLFEFWIRSLDNNGKPNKPDAMYQAKEFDAAVKLIDRYHFKP